LEVAPTREQGGSFVVVVVSQAMLGSSDDQADVEALLGSEYGPVPIVFMAQDAGGAPTYLGRPDLVDFLSQSVLVEELPWQRVTFSDS